MDIAVAFYDAEYDVLMHVLPLKMEGEKICTESLHLLSLDGSPSSPLFAPTFREMEGEEVWVGGYLRQRKCDGRVSRVEQHFSYELDEVRFSSAATKDRPTSTSGKITAREERARGRSVNMMAELHPDDSQWRSVLLVSVTFTDQL